MDRAVAEHAAEELDKTTVLHGDALNFELLEEAGVGNVETMVAVSNDDQVNILGALLAKQHGAERAVALVNSPNYGLLTGRLGIDAVVNPRGITVSTVLSFVRSGSVVEINSILDGFGEVLEFQVHATAAAAGKGLGRFKTARWGVDWRADPRRWHYMNGEPAIPASPFRIGWCFSSLPSIL